MAVSQVFWNFIIVRAGLQFSKILIRSSNICNYFTRMYADVCQLHHVDGLTQPRVRQQLEGNSCSDIFTLVGDSGSTLGAVSNLSVLPLYKYLSLAHTCT